ncbi:hypothetical protein MMC25_007606 [Agyrium rufum]|nr:hypothetical protein [Agyrium rufum]
MAQGTIGGSQASCTGEAFSYLGCYSDAQNGAHAGFTFRLSSDPSSPYYYPGYTGGITIESCLSGCRGHGFRYAALYDAASCYCSAALPNPGAQESAALGPAPAQGSSPGSTVDASVCHVIGNPCAGNAAEFCGSLTATDIYEDTSFSTLTAVGAAENFLYLGCFSNNSPAPLYATLETPDTADCAAYCGALGYAYMGRSGYNSETNSATCGCGTELQSGNQVDEMHCNYFCDRTSNAEGDASTCGGNGYWSVFRNPQLQGCYSPPLPGSVAGFTYITPRDAGGAAATSSAQIAQFTTTVYETTTTSVITTTSVYTTVTSDHTVTSTLTTTYLTTAATTTTQTQFIVIPATSQPIVIINTAVVSASDFEYSFPTILSGAQSLFHSGSVHN